MVVTGSNRSRIVVVTVALVNTDIDQNRRVSKTPSRRIQRACHKPPRCRTIITKAFSGADIDEGRKRESTTDPDNTSRAPRPHRNAPALDRPGAGPVVVDSYRRRRMVPG